MARAQTKTDLLTSASSQYEKLWKLISSIPNDIRLGIFAFEDRDKNLRDVLVHLYEWHQLLIKWVNSNRVGDAQPFLPEPYNWKTYPQMNVGFWERHQSTQYADAVKMLDNSHKTVLLLIGEFTDEELFEKKHFAWTGTTSLGSYCVSATASHYDWAIKKIKQHVKTYAN